MANPTIEALNNIATNILAERVVRAFNEIKIENPGTGPSIDEIVMTQPMTAISNNSIAIGAREDEIIRQRMFLERELARHAERQLRVTFPEDIARDLMAYHGIDVNENK